MKNPMDRFRLGCFSLCLVVVACVPGPQGTPCERSDECPEDRTCYAGLCLIDDRSAPGADPNVDAGQPPAVDGDGDGYTAGDDCDDTDPDVHPGAAENPSDGVDNNCNDQIDEDPGAIDSDGDGYTGADDCNEGDPNINAGAEDDSADGTDQNCDGVDGPRTEPCAGEGLTRCESGDVSVCVDLQEHRKHCGHCGRECGSLENCVDGRCSGMSELPGWCEGDLSVEPVIWENEDGGDTGNGHIYWFCSGTADETISQETWSQRCQRAGGHLLTVSSDDEDGFVIYANSEALEGDSAYYFVGAMWSANDGDWVWANGEDQVHDPWNGNGPSNNEDQRCGVLQGGGAETDWATSSCEEMGYGAICEFAP